MSNYTMSLKLLGRRTRSWKASSEAILWRRRHGNPWRICRSLVSLDFSRKFWIEEWRKVLLSYSRLHSLKKGSSPSKAAERASKLVHIRIRGRTAEGLRSSRRHDDRFRDAVWFPWHSMYNLVQFVHWKQVNGCAHADRFLLYTYHWSEVRRRLGGWITQVLSAPNKRYLFGLSLEISHRYGVMITM
jgi:hypothetical protein